MDDKAKSKEFFFLTFYVNYNVVDLFGLNTTVLYKQQLRRVND